MAAELLRLPRSATAKALSSRQTGKRLSASLDALFTGWAVKLARHLPMDEYKHIRLKRTLAAAGLDTSPEVYSAYALVKAGAVLLAAVPCLFVLPLLAPLLAALAVALYFKESRRAAELVSVQRDAIEADLPRMVATICQEIKGSRDVLRILETFRSTAGPSLASELGVLTADMRSSNYEAALMRCEARINSPMLSDVIRGLIGVLRGDDGRMYFEILQHDMKQLELQRLKAKANKIPPKIRVFSFVMLLCFMLTFLAIIIYAAVTSLGGMF
nr:secretion protein F [Pseudoflavonifractor phocaeensis]